jgi:hypothetical protein
MKRRFLALFDRYAVGALVLTLGVGWALWRTNLEHESDYKRDKKDRLPKREKVRRWLRTSFWPEDGAPGVRGTPGARGFGPPPRIVVAACGHEALELRDGHFGDVDAVGRERDVPHGRLVGRPPAAELERARGDVHGRGQKRADEEQHGGRYHAR